MNDNAVADVRIDDGKKSDVPTTVQPKTEPKTDLLELSSLQSPDALDAMIAQVTEKAEADLPVTRLLFEGMRPSVQPAGYTNERVRESPDGRYSAFLSIADCASRIIVVDKSSGTQRIVPAPPEGTYECRSIRQFEWTPDSTSLYILEDGTRGIRERAKLKALSLDEFLAERKRMAYALFYRYTLGENSVVELDRIRPAVLSLAAGNDHVYVVTEAEEKEWGYLDFRQYRGGKLESTRTIHLGMDGVAMEHDHLQILPDRNEAWFTTLWDDKGMKPGTTGDRRWLAFVDLKSDPPVPRLVFPNVLEYLWAPDGEAVVCHVTELDKPNLKIYMSIVLLKRGNWASPRFLAKEDFTRPRMGIHLAGFDSAGKTLYHAASTRDRVESGDERANGAIGIFEMPIHR